MNTSEHISNCINALSNNGVIILPTDTILGLCCNAESEISTEKIIQLKNRKDSKGFVVLVSSMDDIQNYVQEFSSTAKKLIEESTKPISIIYPNGKNVSKHALGEDGSIAIRVVHSGFAHDLLKAYGKAIVATSVNISGTDAALNADTVPDTILKAVDYVVNLPLQNEAGSKASTIVKINSNGQTEIIRD